MRQAVIVAPGRLEIREAPEPQPGPGEVRVAGAVVGICGSDLHAFEGAHPWIDLPVVPGHEVAGAVEAVGSNVRDLAPGDAVVLEANLVCGRCLYCTSGRYNLCSSLEVVGCQTSGGMGDSFVAPADRFHKIPEGMTMPAAALIEPLSTATHAVRIVGGVEGAVVAVLGAGSIGLLTLLTARASGAEAIAMTDPVPHKRERAIRLGADIAADPGDEGVVEYIRSALPRRPDVVFDCVATQSSSDQALALALKGGTVAVVGVPRSSVQIALPLVQDREVRIQGVAMYVGADVKHAIELVRRGDVRPEDLVTATYPLAEAGAAFEAARSNAHVKILISP